MFSIGSILPQVKAKSQQSQQQQNTQSGNQQVVLAPQPERPNQNTNIDYSLILRNDSNKERAIQSTLEDVIPLKQRQKNISLAKPSQLEIDETTERTRKALDEILQKKLGKSIKTNSHKNPEYIRYTSSNILDNNPTSSRIIKIVDAQEDPMAPIKFKQKKNIARPSSPPAPVLHAPTRKATAEEQKQWYIPPAISNWKNPNGFTIALDKRLAVDGRDPNRDDTQGEINSNFLNLANALDDADKKAREDIKLRNAMKKKIAEKETREKEERLRILAQKAREEKGITSGNFNSRYENENDEVKKRAMIREERRKQAEKELRMSRMGKEQKTQNLIKSLGNREVSERTKLGLAKPTNSIENQFDSRLFTNSTQVTNSEDQVYDNPLFVQQDVNNIYKVSDSMKGSNQNDPDSQLESLQNEKRFDSIGNSSSNQGPIEFQKDETTHESKIDESEYGLRIKRQKNNE
ncbi:Puff-specific protein Bx42 [Wickerhamomyces ciferrii]|uniref:Pre-mRNA-processing protein 45 n=1 Tax=Wickerhamomyces ciferrii (strain ATCC 14091 / BCRC 22168 / CBS 111 / JCM 3599 / NBRC 0793 / NRRL Y-1031 F-60-10) TaxID=1206466 RepID=K0KYG8_WICCF|nr:Puff-specific protein Bx42 [Wickerhamomyces ciferrii]CCH47122.1 Puff-specific protein Bx42 [Wickerhamomyces ciferrii]